MPFSRFVAPAALVLALAVGGCKREQPAFQQPPPPPVTVQHPVEMTLDDYLDFTGSLRAFESAEVRPQVSGFINKIHFVADSHVKVGDLLFTIDPRPYEATLQSAQAALQGKQASLKAAEVKLTQTKQLIESQSASELELIERTADYDLARADVATAEANIRTAQLNLDFTRVTALINGRISRNLVDVGNLVGTGNPTLLATIVNDEKIYAYFNVSESAFNDYVRNNPEKRVRDSDDTPATPVFMGTISDPGYPFTGKIDSGDNRIDPDTGTYEVRAIFDNPQRTLTPGAYVKLRALVGRSKALLVPDQAVQLDQQGRFVAVVKADGTVERRPVVVSTKTGNYRRVVEGLTTQDQVVVNGIQSARPGAKVTPKLEDMPVKIEDLSQRLPSTNPALNPTTGPAPVPTGNPSTRPVGNLPGAPGDPTTAPDSNTFRPEADVPPVLPPGEGGQPQSEAK